MTDNSIYIDCSAMPFLRPYLLREFGEERVIVSTDAAAAYPSVSTVVVISTADVYGNEFERASESDAVVACDALSREQSMEAKARKAGARRILILRSAPVVGTGMTGYPRRLVGRVASGVFMQIDGADGRRSVVHATDLALAARLLVEKSTAEGVFNVSDAADPTVGELAEALAFRLGQKRIFKLKASWARWLPCKRSLARRRLERTISIARLCAETDFSPVPVTEYLRSHVYDSSSL